MSRRSPRNSDELNLDQEERRNLLIVDSSVHLYDGDAIMNFKEHDLVVPAVCFEELEDVKRGKRRKGEEDRQARIFLDHINSMNGKLSAGVRIGPEKGTLYVMREPTGMKAKKLSSAYEIFGKVSSSNAVLNLLNFLTHSHPRRRVVLVTKDRYLRAKARAMDLLSEDYQHQKVKLDLYDGVRKIEVDDTEVIQRLIRKGSIELEDLDQESTRGLLTNQYVILQNHTLSGIAILSATSGKLEVVERRVCSGIYPKNPEQIMAMNALTNPDITIVTLTGVAGTGKTILALAAGISQGSDYRRVLATRPIVELSGGDKIGFLPGELGDKVGPYMQPLRDNLGLIQRSEKQPHHKKRGTENQSIGSNVDILALPFIRGRSLQKVFVLGDEAQNLTPGEAKALVTRAGYETKVVLVGDLEQVDAPNLDRYDNGLAHVIEKFKGESNFAHVNLVRGERSDLAEQAARLL